MKRQSRRVDSGFSLLELLIVLAVMTILGGIGLSGLGGLRRWIAQQDSQALFHELQTACLRFRMENGSWPDSLRAGEIFLNGSSEAWRSDLAPYMERNLREATFMDGHGNTDLRLVVDVDGDHWIRKSELNELSPVDLWERVALYSLDGNGQLAWASWWGREGR